MSVYTEYAEHLRTLDPEQYLGFLAWYSVAEDLSIDHGKLHNALTLAGLARHTPRAPSDSDVFRRSCSAAQRKRVDTTTPGVFANYLIRDPGGDSDLIVRKVVREQVDSANRRLDHEVVAEIVFVRETAGVSYKLFTVSTDVTEICDKVVASYMAERGHLNGYGIRELIRKVLIDANATNVRPSGGVYFLPASQSDVCAGLEEVAASLGNSVTMHSLPLIDDSKQRGMLKRAFEAESIERAQSLTAEIAEIGKKGKPITTDKYASYVTQLNELKGKLGEYTDLLQSNLTSTGSALSILQRQVIGLMQHVDKKGK